MAIKPAWRRDGTVEGSKAKLLRDGPTVVPRETPGSSPGWKARLRAWWEGYDLQKHHAKRRQASRTAPYGGKAPPAPRPQDAEGKPPEGSKAKAVQEFFAAVDGDYIPPELRAGAGPAPVRRPAETAAEAAAPAPPTVPAQPAAPQPAPPPAAIPAPLEVAESPRPAWDAARIDAAEQVWGRGFVTPGGPAHVAELTKPLGLNPSMSILNLGAGLGGVSRKLAKDSGAWVTGLESDKVLAEAAMTRSRSAGMDRQAPVLHYDPETFKLSKRYDAVFAKEAFFTVKDKLRFFDTLAQGVKPRGQLLFTDYTLDPHLDDVKAVHAWQDQTDAEPHMLTLKQYVSQLANRGFEVRVVEDLTDVHRRTILTSWQRLYESLKAKQEGGAEARNDQLTAEADRWGKCVMAIKGGLRVHRFMALRMRT